ncbi:MAG: flagellar biosynthesis repressor FlbT [Devosia sp.]|uniref:flagellar biosynthesis repressor FlbT n=1 Tax=Devosia sp. TaxID=1871048 RepID=UPI003397FDCD
MTLKLTLKPGEGVLIGNSRIEVLARGMSTLLISGDAPVLRAEFAIDPGDVVDTPTRLRQVLQKMYLGGDMAAHHDEYFDLARRLLMDSPTALDWITGINKCLVVGDVYKAIKLAKEQRWPPGSQVIAKAS